MQHERGIGRRVSIVVGLLVVPIVVLAGCNDDGRELRPAKPSQNESISTTGPPSSDTFEDNFPDVTLLPSEVPNQLSVTAPWADGAPIDPRFTCDGDNVSPPLVWSTAPDGTAEIAIELRDDNAPDFVHWVIAGLPATATRLGEAASLTSAIVGQNSAGSVGYTGPCPPVGQTHTYRIVVHYLGQQLDLGSGLPGADLGLAVRASAIASAEITGSYSR